MEDLDLPEIKRKKLQEKKADDKKEFKDLFQSDSGSDDDDDGGLRIKGKPDCRKRVSFEGASHDTLSSRWLCLSQTGPVLGES